MRSIYYKMPMRTGWFEHCDDLLVITSFIASMYICITLSGSCNNLSISLQYNMKITSIYTSTCSRLFSLMTRRFACLALLLSWPCGSRVRHGTINSGLTLVTLHSAFFWGNCRGFKGILSSVFTVEHKSLNDGSHRALCSTQFIIDMN